VQAVIERQCLEVRTGFHFKIPGDPDQTSRHCFKTVYIFIFDKIPDMVYIFIFDNA